MVEVSTSILNVKKGEESKTFFGLEAGKTDYFHIDVMDWKVCGERYISKNVRIFIIYKKNIKFTFRCSFNGKRYKISNRRFYSS